MTTLWRHTAQAIALKPGDSDTHGQLSLTLAHAGKIDDAMREVQEVGKLDKALAGQSYYNIGAILVNGGKTKDAAEAFKKSVEMDPRNAESYYQLGSAYFASPDTVPQAITAFEKYLELQPSGTYSAAAKQYISAGKNRIRDREVISAGGIRVTGWPPNAEMTNDY